MKKIISFVLCIFVLVSCFSQVFAAEDKALFEVEAEIYDYLKNAVLSPEFGSVGGEWAVIALARSGRTTEDGYFEKYYENLERYVKKEKGMLHDFKYTEYSRAALAVTAIGKNPENVGGYNLLMPLGDFEKTIRQGINGAIWALISLDSKNYQIPQNAEAKTQATREKYIDYILENRLTDGGWSLSGEESEVDLTAMALQALSRYKSDAKVLPAVECGLDYLSGCQNESGGFDGFDGETAESCAQVLTALSALEISFEDERFEKNGNTVVDAVLSYYINGGGFKHIKTSAASNQMATEQCYYALVAAKRFEEGKTALYDMSDVEFLEDDVKEGLFLKNPNVKKALVSSSQKTFEDLEELECKSAVEALAKRNIINGKTESQFDPSGTAERCEFAAIVTRALGLDTTAAEHFEDVKKDDWFFMPVETAFAFGIVKGESETNFNPHGTITVEEAAVILERAAVLCGMKSAADETEADDVLAVFSDYKKVSAWAKSSLAFCYKEKIFSDSDAKINPNKFITRGEIAEAVYNLLSVANLL